MDEDKTKSTQTCMILAIFDTTNDIKSNPLVYEVGRNLATLSMTVATPMLAPPSNAGRTSIATTT